MYEQFDFMSRAKNLAVKWQKLISCKDIMVHVYLFIGFEVGKPQVAIECRHNDRQFSTSIASSVCRTGTNINEVIPRNFLNKELLNLCWLVTSSSQPLCYIRRMFLKKILNDLFINKCIYKECIASNILIFRY